MSIIDDINANTQAIISGKSLVTNAIIEKGGTVEQVGALPTFYELAEAIEGIEAGGGGGSTGKGLACIPLTNLKVMQVSENLARITWDNPDDPNRARIQIRTAVGYVPTIPESSSDIIQDYPADTNELNLNLEGVSVGGVVGVWVVPVNLVGEIQTLRNTNNTQIVEKLAIVDSVLDLDGTNAVNSNAKHVGACMNDVGDMVLLPMTNESSRLSPKYVDRDTGAIVESTFNKTVWSGYRSSLELIPRRAFVVDPENQDMYISCNDASYAYLLRFNKAEKTIKSVKSYYAGSGTSAKGWFNVYLGADGCIYCVGTNGAITCIEGGTGATLSVSGYTGYSGLTTMFTYAGKTYVMNVGRALGTIERGVYTPLNVGTLTQEIVENDELLYAYPDGTLIIGSYDNRKGRDPLRTYKLSHGIVVVNINTGSVEYLRGETTENRDTFSRAVPLPSGNLLLIGSLGKGGATSYNVQFRTTIAIYNKTLNTISTLNTGACDWNYIFTEDRSKIIITKGSKYSYFDEGETSGSSIGGTRVGASFGIFDVATETYEQKSPEFVKGNFYYDYNTHMIKVTPYRMSNGRYIILGSIVYSNTSGTPIGDYARLYDESTNDFIQLSHQCYHYLAQTSVGDYSSNIDGHLVKYNTVLNDFEEVPEVNTVDVGALLDYRETNRYIYLVGRKYIVYYDKTTGVHQAVLSNYGGLPLPALSGTKYVYGSTAYNPVTGYEFPLTGTSYNKVVQTNEAKTASMTYDRTKQRVLIT